MRAAGEASLLFLVERAVNVPLCLLACLLAWLRWTDSVIFARKARLRRAQERRDQVAWKELVGEPQLWRNVGRINGGKRGDSVCYREVVLPSFWTGRIDY